MTVRINKPALNLREEISKAQGVVRYEQRQFWMDGLVENGTFDNDTSGWISNDYSYFSITSGVITGDTTAGSSGLAPFLVQTLTLEVGKTYTLLVSGFELLEGFWTQVKVDGLVVLQINSTTSNSGDYDEVSKIGKYTFTATKKSYPLTWAVRADNTKATIDNIQVFEVDENDNVIHSVPLGFKPVHVYEDGLLQREGDVHDYTVVKTGGAYAIKPAVQPTGATETCVIAEREL